MLETSLINQLSGLTRLTIPFSKTSLHWRRINLVTMESTSRWYKNPRTQSFYFCSSYDVTHTVQRLSTFPPEFMKQPLFDRQTRGLCGTRIYWRLEWTIGIEKKYCLPIMHGSLVSRKWLWIRVHSNGFLFSRRILKGQERGLFMRGCDSEGNPANYVEQSKL